MIAEPLDLDSSFVIYSTPDEDFGDFWFLSGSGLTLDEVDLNSPGFICHPFEKSDEAFMLKGIAHPMELYPESSKVIGFPIDPPEEKYLEKIGAVLNEIKSGDCDKVVLSRVKEIYLDEIKVKEALARLKFDNLGCLVYLVHHPLVGTWIGATPETLLRQKRGHYSTMALAGTKLSKDERDWTQKEQNEQKIVSDYILEALTKAGVTAIETHGPETTTAGELSHIRTVFNFQTDDIGRVIQSLHPTPAVCGSPVGKARDIISDLETQSRGYYCGYLGPVSNKGDFHLFVNLRCAEILKDHLRLHVGGGITANSNPEDEWQETEHKAQTLLRVL